MMGVGWGSWFNPPPIRQFYVLLVNETKSVLSALWEFLKYFFHKFCVGFFFWKIYIRRGIVILCTESWAFCLYFGAIFARKYGNLPINSKFWTWIVQKRSCMICIEQKICLEHGSIGSNTKCYYRRRFITFSRLNFVTCLRWSYSRIPQDRVPVYKIVLKNKFGIIGNTIGHRHANSTKVVVGQNMGKMLGGHQKW